MCQYFAFPSNVVSARREVHHRVEEAIDIQLPSHQLADQHANRLNSAQK